MVDPIEIKFDPHGLGGFTLFIPQYKIAILWYSYYRTTFQLGNGYLERYTSKHTTFISPSLRLTISS